MEDETDNTPDCEQWMPGEGIRVNPGRDATPLGNDGILPFVDIPDWLSERFRQALESKGIHYSLWTAFLKVYDPEIDDPEAGELETGHAETDDNEPCCASDRYSFPWAEALVLQRLVDAVVEQNRPGYVNSLGLYMDPRMEFRVAHGIFEEARNILDRPIGTQRDRLRWAFEHFASVDQAELPEGEERSLFDHVGVAGEGVTPTEGPESVLDLLAEMSEKEVADLATKIHEIADYIRYRPDSG